MRLSEKESDKILVPVIDMKIEDAFKYVISGGVLKPNNLPHEVPIKKES